MKIRISKSLLAIGALLSSVTSCTVYKRPATGAVSYQSVRTTNTVNGTPTIPADAKIACVYSFDEDGNLTVFVQNLTSEIMTIDQTKSFFIGSNGMSQSYYDPTVTMSSTTESSSSTRGGSVNLGAVAGVLGIGGQ